MSFGETSVKQDPALLDNLDERVIDLIARHQRLQPGKVTIDSTFASLAIDSLDGMELVFEFEEAFNITIPDEVARQMASVRGAVESLRQALTSSAVSGPEPGVPPAPAS
jgi:acyl carrier protein